jgi:hypothetical protein
MFVLSEEHLLRLWRLNQFAVPSDRWVFFGLRGCLPVDDDNHEFARSHTLRVETVDYTHPRCTLGQWQPGKGFAVFAGSTSPHRKHVEESRLQGGVGTNQLLTGFYADYRKGVHKAGTPTAHDAFRQDHELPVQRTGDDVDFDADDRVEFEKPFNNLHAAWSQGIGHDSYASAGCQVVVGFPKCPKLGMSPATGAWKVFQENAYALAQDSFSYVLLTGFDAERIVHATTTPAPRLRYGSKGVLVTRVQAALKQRGFYHGELDDDFGIDTLRAVLAFQTAQFGPQGDDGIVGKQTASALGIAWPDSLAGIALVTPPPPAARGTPAAPAMPVAPARAAVRFDGDHALTPDGVRFAKRFRLGVFTSGSTSIAQFVQSHRASFPGIAPSLLRVLEAVSANEGNLEAVNTWDDSFMTFGIFQWTAGRDGGRGELGALLDRLAREHANVFTELFGRHGLSIQGVTAAPGTTPTGTLALDGKPLDTPAKKERLRTLEWAYRFWLAGHHEAVRVVQIEQAMDRLGIFYRSAKHRIAGRPIADYVTSEAGVALLLDQHLNRPGHVPKTLAAAVAQLPEKLAAKPARWKDQHERDLIERYLTLRAATTMTDSDKRAQVVLDAVSRGVISDRRGSFQP